MVVPCSDESQKIESGFYAEIGSISISGEPSTPLIPAPAKANIISKIVREKKHIPKKYPANTKGIIFKKINESH